MSSIVKKLKVMPTSQILLEDYCGEISLKDKDVSNMFTKRMHKKYKISDATIQKIINRDREIFDRRGNESSFYAFDSQHGLYDTLDILYDYIQPTDPERWFFVTQRFLDLTFSELAVASRLFLNLGAVHSLNGIHLEKTAGDLEQERNEKALGEYYEYLNKSARTFLRVNTDCHSSIVQPSFSDSFKTSKISIYESQNHFSKNALLYKEFLNTKKNEDAYNREMQLIEEHPNMKQIYQKRR